MKQTTIYKLSQWDPEDRIRREDFNADNLKLESTLLNLQNSAASMKWTLDRKLGQSELINDYKSTGKLSRGCGFAQPVRNWSDWECVCILAHYPGTSAENNTPLMFSIFHTGDDYLHLRPIPLPGYLVVFTPRHDGTKPVAGFLFADRFTPFSCNFSYDSIFQLDCVTQNGDYIISPNVSIFGMK